MHVISVNTFCNIARWCFIIHLASVWGLPPPLIDQLPQFSCLAATDTRKVERLVAQRISIAGHGYERSGGGQ